MPRSLIKPPEGYPTATCPGCDTRFQPSRHDQLYCTKACRCDANNFEKVRGQMLYRAVYHWVLSGGRMGKAPKGASIGEITRLVRDEWIAADKRAGRAIPPLPFTNR